MRALAGIVFAAGVAVVIVGGVALAATLRAYDGCVDECHGGLLWGAGSVALITLGLAVLGVGVALLTQVDGRSSRGSRVR